jgi:DNA-binding ferritin-like protein
MAERLTFLEAHQQQVTEHMRELAENLAVIEKKIRRIRSTLNEEGKDTTSGRLVTVPDFSTVTQNHEKEATSLS